MNCKCLLFLTLFAVVATVISAHANGEETRDELREYIRQNRTSQWSLESKDRWVDGEKHRLRLNGAEWKGSHWKHDILLITPDSLVHQDIAYLHIGGSRDPESLFPILEQVAKRGKAYAAAVSDIPNQPLLDGKKEDGLLAYSFQQFEKTGDPQWPVLFPMVLAVVQAMDTLQKYTETLPGKKTINKFVVGGASKRGWTTYLVATVDDRVSAIAPMVFEMVNMKAQTDWAQKHYGAQSERIREYTQLGLIDRILSPRITQLRSWVDPYERRASLDIPKLIVLGTNDRYWVVDATRHYVPELPGSTLLTQVLNGTHGDWDSPSVVETVSTWFAHLAHGAPLPSGSWKVQEESDIATIVAPSLPSEGKCSIAVAKSKDRDFRDDLWEIETPLDRPCRASRKAPRAGFEASLITYEILTSYGRLSLSSQAVVLPQY
jgi:PhoPQ-activated pathogenicity-related protein